MSDRATLGTSDKTLPSGDSIANQTTRNSAIHVKGMGLQTSGTNSSKDDREKMSAYVAFVDAQAEECLERLENEIERNLHRG